MDVYVIIGWLFLLASWVPKPFIKNDQIRLNFNLALCVAACCVFIAGMVTLF
jgi:hypothetical protein